MLIGLGSAVGIVSRNIDGGGETIRGFLVRQACRRSQGSRFGVQGFGVQGFRALGFMV